MTSRMGGEGERQGGLQEEWMGGQPWGLHGGPYFQRTEWRIGRQIGGGVTAAHAAAQGSRR